MIMIIASSLNFISSRVKLIHRHMSVNPPIQKDKNTKLIFSKLSQYKEDTLDLPL